MSRKRKIFKVKKSKPRKSALQTITQAAATPSNQNPKKQPSFLSMLFFGIAMCIVASIVVVKITVKTDEIIHRSPATISTTAPEIERTIPKIETLTTETEIITTETEIITTETEIETEPQPVILHFIVNTDSCCIHIDPHCTAAEAIEPDHRQEIDIPETDLPAYAGKFWACGKCSRKYSSDLPKFEN